MMAVLVLVSPSCVSPSNTKLMHSIKSGPPVKVMIRSPKLGVEEFVDEIRATQLAGFKGRREAAASVNRG